MPTIDDTLALIRRLHEGQTDKQGAPYWQHPAAVMGLLGEDASDDERHAALLHDVLEDTATTEDDLLRLGYSRETVRIVRALTRPEGVEYQDWIASIAASGDAAVVRVKLADIRHNLDQSRGPIPDHLWSRYAIALAKLSRCGNSARPPI